MDNRGLTLTELIVGMVISGIIFLALTCQFVAELTFRTMINDQIAATDEASIVMRHMTRVLRYAKPLAAGWATPAAGYVTSITATINHAAAHPAVNCDNLPEFIADTVVIYRRKSDNTFEYKIGTAVPIIISNRITDFPVIATWWASPNLTIQLTAQQGSRRSSLNTKIRLLGI
jgi:prepilin-type N-terminal cleavage/methylation domain-containing protein